MNPGPSTAAGSTLRLERLVPYALRITGSALLLTAAAATLADRDLAPPGLAIGLLGLVGFALLLHAASLTAPGGWHRIPGPAELERADVREHLAKFGAIAAQLALLAVVIRLFSVENAAFYERVVPLTLAAFVLNHLLPLEYRLRFFVGASITGVLLVFGPGSGAWLLAIGLVLIGICHLPIPFRARVALLLAAGAGLAFLRIGGGFRAPWSSAIWPILGSMFMFRLIIYMYDLRHAKEPARPARTLSYFFLLPNVVFPLFPTVDYATFRRTYYDADPFWIYQRGVQWMLRGVVHLMLYRLVYHHLVITPAEVADTTDLLRYLVANFLLYLKVSGLFHMIVGMLHLFGFHLPETHRLFYLSSSFTDFWRRINIYWKDFMMKVFYYPAYFRLRKRGDTFAIVVSTLIVFFATWFLHSYQWFWILGTFLISWPDVLFWLILAVLLVVNSLHEAKHGRKRSLGARVWSPGQRTGQALRIAGTFATICILWSLWTAPTVGDWLNLWAVAGRPQSLAGIGGMAVVPALLLGVVTVRDRVRRGVEGVAGQPAGARTPTFRRVVVRTGAGIVLLLLVAVSMAVADRFGPRASALARTLRTAELNRRDATLLQRGYYERLVGVTRLNGQLWEVYMKRPQAARGIWETEVGHVRGDFLGRELRPDRSVEFYGMPFTTNRWGMRDRDYARERPAGVHRTAVLGASVPMGWGVRDGETFEALVERALNEPSGDPGRPRYEWLNFGVAGYTPAQYLRLLEDRIGGFEPNIVLVIAHGSDPSDAVWHLADVARRGIAIPYNDLRVFVRQAGIQQGMAHDEARRRLGPHADSILARVYGRIVRATRELGAIPAWVYIPTHEAPTTPEQLATLIQLARDAGFAVLDLSDVYDGHDPATLQLSEWDWHPNAKAHALIADRLASALRVHGESLGLDLPAAPEIRAVAAP